jgi:Fe-S-cluster containining protein
MNESGNERIFKPLTDDKFQFKCHKNIGCFTKCCAALNLLLTPYDILRLKNRLNILSGVFLENYTDTKIDDRSKFPMVYLKMSDNEKKTCPFLKMDGCRIYEDRPSACRIYPLGRATTKPIGKAKVTERFFLVMEDHCMGFNEEKQWTIEGWLCNEGLEKYNSMNDQWMEIITSENNLGSDDSLIKKIQMFYMASYNLDKFKDFLFKSAFFNRFKVSQSMKDKIYQNDEELLNFSFKWLKFSLFGEKTISIRS